MTCAKRCSGTAFLSLLLLWACSNTPDEKQEMRPLAGKALLSSGLSPTLQTLSKQAAERIQQGVSRKRLESTLKRLVARPHVAGSTADRRTAEYVHGQFLAAGLESRIQEYEVLLPRPEQVLVEMLKPVAFEASLKEEPVDQDFDTHTPQAIKPFLAYAPDGEVTAPLVYVNRATRQDLEQLQKQNVKLKGAIGIARYGGIYRGSKLKNASGAGLAALILYSDPADYGFMKGDVYPNGPYLPASGVQRGSVLDLSAYPGDPLTPGEPAFARARRLPVQEAKSLPTTPAVVLSARDARPFLENLKGPAVPQGWQGGLPFTYHLGGRQQVLVHIKLQSDWKLRKIWNVVGTLRGTAFPHTWVMVGNHRDAWVHGAVDPSSGTTVMLEAARVLGDLARHGLAPARSILFCSWDGEEYGLLGSTEEVEAEKDSISRAALLYLNLDTAVSGPHFSASASPSLEILLKGALKALPDPSRPAGSLLDLLGSKPLAPPGGGSDFEAFEAFLGLPVMDLGSRGPYGVYHSLYDTFGWMKHFGDPGFETHARMARVAATLLWRAANTNVLPYDWRALGRFIESSLQTLFKRHPELPAEDLEQALLSFQQQAQRQQPLLQRFLTTDPDPLLAHRLTLSLKSIFPLFLDPASGQGSPPRFFRNLLIIPDPATGYRARPLGLLWQALHEKNQAEVERLTKALEEALSKAALRLQTINDNLEQRLS